MSRTLKIGHIYGIGGKLISPFVDDTDMALPCMFCAFRTEKSNCRKYDCTSTSRTDNVAVIFKVVSNEPL